jgi:CPA1 family monovalent cation:H+ antiporter
MSAQYIIAILISITAAAGYINYRFIKLPSATGIILITLVISIVLMIFDKSGFAFSLDDYARAILEGIDFNDTFMNGMLSFLLFAGALHVNVIELAKQKLIIGMLATIGVVISTFIVGFALYWLTHWGGLDFPLSACLIFGALIAPTDPIAVLSALKTSNAPKKLEVKIAGESLFNDGIGIVMFVIMLSFYSGGAEFSGKQIALMFFQQLVGGIFVGLLLGYITVYLLTGVNNLQVAILITLSLVTGGYLLATSLGVSGPIAMVVAGLMVGAKLHSGINMSKRTLQLLDGFWEMIDETLTALLFVLIGLELMRLQVDTTALAVALFAIPIVLFARYISVGGPMLLVRKAYANLLHQSILIMTWGGLRGGVSIALALSLPEGAIKNDILTITYSVVVFSILVQGLTINNLIRSTVVQPTTTSDTNSSNN